MAVRPGRRARASKPGADELAGQRGGSGDPQRSQRGLPGSGWWTEGPVGSFAQRKDQKQGLTCKEIPWAAFLALWTRGSCRGREGAEGQGQRLGDRSAQESGREGAAGGRGQLVRGGGREGGEERNSQRFSPFPGPLEEFTDRRKTERTDLVDRSGAHARNGWAAGDQRATQRGHQGGT